MNIQIRTTVVRQTRVSHFAELSQKGVRGLVDSTKLKSTSMTFASAFAAAA
jgi:hypothetical protein